jgi:uncharacterized RDD family membrane protein YckC
MAPPPPPSGGYAPPPGGYPMQQSGMGGMATTGNLASPGLRIVGGLIDVIILSVILFVLNLILSAIFRGASGIISLVVDLVVYVGGLAYLWSSQGASIGMMPFGFKVRDQQTGQYPTFGKAALRGVIWYLEVAFTICIIGAIGWLWQLWDPQKQAIHDKVAGTIVTQG